MIWMVLILTLNVGGLLVLVASLPAVFFTGKMSAQVRPDWWRKLWDRRWEAGILLGLLSVFSFYPVYGDGKWSTVWGIPFLMAVTGGGEDHPHGPGLISTVLNFLFWLLLPQFVLWVTSGRRRVQGTGSHDAAPPA